MPSTKRINKPYPELIRLRLVASNLCPLEKNRPLNNSPACPGLINPIVLPPKKE
jgi:hypothetical protein